MNRLLDTLLQKARLKPRPPEDPAATRYGDLNERAIAAAIDVVLLYLMLFPLFLWIQAHLFYYTDQEKLEAGWHQLANPATADILVGALRLLWESHQPLLWLLNSFVQVGIIGVFIVGVQWRYGTTPGKWLLGLRIVRAGSLARPSRRQFVIRYLSYLVSTLPLMLGIVWISFDAERRGWHDRIARTVVIQTRPRGWYYMQAKRGFKWLCAKCAIRS